MCRRCKKRAAKEGSRTCVECLSVSSALESKKSNQRRVEGKCTFCGAERDREGTLCVKCATKSRENVRKNMLARLSTGMCNRCGVEPFTQSVDGKQLSKMCQRCYLKNMAGKHLGSGLKWTVLLDKLYRCNWQCIYTAEPLTPGINLSFDHLDPVSRFPDKKYEASNVEPCSKVINLMKRDMTQNEFVKMCSTVIQWNTINTRVA